MARLRPLLRRLPMLTSNTALVSLAMLCAVWVASQFRMDTVGWAGFDDPAAATWHAWGASSDAGRVVFYRMNTGTFRLDEAPRILSGVNVPGMQPHVFHHGANWTQRWSWGKPVVYKDFPEGGLVPGGSPFRLRFLVVSYWLLALMLAIVAAPAAKRLTHHLIARWRPAPGCCRRCGYDLRASPGRCPECGTDIAAPVTRLLAADGQG